jgi:hypothetical protein
MMSAAISAYITPACRISSKCGSIPASGRERRRSLFRMAAKNRKRTLHTRRAPLAEWKRSALQRSNYQPQTNFLDERLFRSFSLATAKAHHNIMT